MKRIKSRFDNLAGKTVARVGWGGQFFWIVFTDETFVFLDAHNFAMDYDSDIADSWKVDIGLISQEAYQEIEEARKRRTAEYREREERAALAELKAKYPEDAN